MELLQAQAKSFTELGSVLPALAVLQPNLVVVLAAPCFFQNASFDAVLRQAFPMAVRIGCSTAGEITETGVHDNTCVITAIRFANTELKVASARVEGIEQSRQAGRQLATELAVQDLKAILLFGPGVNINGSELIQGVADVAGSNVAVSGGLAGDNGAFERTWTLSPSGISERDVVAVGLGGAAIALAHGSYGGWQPFGPARKVTRADGNILYELDGEPALAIYKRYLGDLAKDLPASGLLFPFAMLSGDLKELGLIRTILGVDEQSGSLILAGDIDPDGYLKLMHASTDALIDGAEIAAKEASSGRAAPIEKLALLVSCVGRKLVMGTRVDEEVDAVRAVLGANVRLTGFYSYGEIAPSGVSQDCKLHNQTMTITVIAEI
jgi:hypothetical protein